MPDIIILMPEPDSLLAQYQNLAWKQFAPGGSRWWGTPVKISVNALLANAGLETALSAIDKFAPNCPVAIGFDKYVKAEMSVYPTEVLAEVARDAWGVQWRDCMEAAGVHALLLQQATTGKDGIAEMNAARWAAYDRLRDHLRDLLEAPGEPYYC